MSSKWFDFDEEELSPEFFASSDRFKLLKKNVGMSSGGRVEETKLRSWSSVNKVGDASDAGMWERLARKSHAGGSDDDDDDDVSESARRMRNRFARDKFDSETDDGRSTRMRLRGMSGSSSNSYGFADVTGRMAATACDEWSRKSSSSSSSYAGRVSFPESSAGSIASDADKTFARSVSINSEDSVCTEKSADCSAVAETLPDGTSKTRFENNETWLAKSKSGSTVCEKKVKDSSVTERNDDRSRDRSTKRMSYVEKSSASGSSLQEESTSERTVSCDKNGTKTVEQKTSSSSSSETYKKAFNCPRNASAFYDQLDLQNRLTKGGKAFDDDGGACYKYGTRGKSVSEKISKLIDEAVQQDNLFKLSSNLGSDIDRMTSDIMDMRFGRDKRRSARRTLSSLYSEDAKSEDANRSKLSELRAENEALHRENSKLQSIIQDVTAVNKRWQRYNNERRLYVQKLLSTIQDLQEQINLISEKSAFGSRRSATQEDAGKLVDKLEREYKEHVAVLELQVKSHKDECDAERREKQKAVREREEMERELQELAREVKFLENVVAEERKRRITFCPSCRSVLDDGEFFPGSGAFSPNAFRTALRVPYKAASAATTRAEDSFFDDRLVLDDGDAWKEEKTAGDTVVVEDESGLRLSITERFPSKDNNNLHLKSILKKSRLAAALSEAKTTTTTTDAEECSASCNLSIGFENGGLANVTSFTPRPIPDGPEPDFFADLLNVAATTATADSRSRSKSEPNTRSNSSENLKPLRESSSWNDQSASHEPEVVCTGCERALSPAYNQFLSPRERKF